MSESGGHVVKCGSLKVVSVWRQSGLPFKSAADCEFYGKSQGISCTCALASRSKDGNKFNQPFAFCRKEMWHLWHHNCTNMSHGLLIENRYKFNALHWSLNKTTFDKETLLPDFGPDGMAEWLRCETCKPRDLKSMTVQPSCLVWAGTLVALYKCEGLFVIE